MILSYDDQGTGPVVVLIHGFPLDRTMWSAQVAALAPKYRVIAPDLRGVGQSPVVDGVYDIESLADDIMETLDSLHITTPCIIGGLSMGGYVAFAILAKYPERVRGLLLLDTRAIADSPTTAKVREELARQVEESNDVGPVVATMMPILFAPNSYTDRPEAVERIRTRASRSSPKALANTLRGLAIRPDRTGMLGSIKVPTLVLAGAEDKIVPLAETQALAAAIPWAQLHVIANAGHLAPIEDPDATNKILLEFLESMGV